MPQISYVDFAQFLLAVTAILLGLLGVAMALGAFVGYKIIRDSAVQQAAKAAAVRIEQYFEGLEQLPDHMIEAIADKVANRVDPRVFISSYQEPPEGDDTDGRKVASDYTD